jgi:hypothetical protein
MGRGDAGHRDSCGVRGAGAYLRLERPHAACRLAGLLLAIAGAGLNVAFFAEIAREFAESAGQ